MPRLAKRLEVRVPADRNPGVPMCDSSGLKLIVNTQQRLTAAGGWLRLAGAQPMVSKVLQITGLIDVLPSYATVDEARQ